MAEAHRIAFIPNPLQRQFIESRPTRLDGSPGADLFSSRMGEGKSAGLAWAAFYHAKNNPGAKWYFIRDTWENLRATTMEEFFRWFPPGIAGHYHETKRIFTWASGLAEGRVGFLGMDDPQDATKLMSRDMGGFGIDEPAPAIGSAGVAEDIFNMAMSRLRQPGMKWYGAKLAENNPDEVHWTYRRFVQPGEPGFRIWQPPSPENIKNLPPTYYQGLRATFANRPDLVRRFVDGDFGFQQVGKSVTPQWNDKLHLAIGLIPVKGTELVLNWDWGHNPTCLITQRTPLGHWNVLNSIVGEETAAEQLIVDLVKPLLIERYRGYSLRHIGDNAGKQREQTSILRTPVKLMTKALGGSWQSGPVKWEPRIEPLRAVLSRTVGGRGLVQVDRHNAPEVWHALRGGWHFHVSRQGIISGEPIKNLHSHPGDAMSYGAAVLFPLGFSMKRTAIREPQAASYGEQSWRIGPARATIPEHGSRLGETR